MEPAEKKKDRKPSLIKRISRKFSLGSKPKLSEEDLIFLVSFVEQIIKKFAFGEGLV